MKKIKKILHPNIHFRVKKPQITISEYVGLALIVAISVASMYIVYKLDYVVAYNDARAHMNMARLVVDNLKPGLAQIGSVWLPLTHVLTLTLVWNNWLWHTGLAGAIFSMIAFVLSNIYIYRLLKDSVNDTVAAVLGTIVFATNLNVLYMQSTPMTELPLLLFFTATSFYLYRWVVANKLVDFLKTAGFVFLATLTRYDGWFLLLSIVGVVFLIEVLKAISTKLSLRENAIKLWNKKSEIEGKLVMFSSLGFLGVFLWLLWNLLIFGDPMYFAFGPFSAKAQQDRIEEAGSLLTKHDLPLSLKAFWWAMVHNAGLLILLFAIVGVIWYIFSKKISIKSLAIYTLLVPLVFHVISLYFGHSILVLPELGFEATEGAKGLWFNVRYGLMILPAVAYFAGFLASKDIVYKVILTILIVVQPLVFLSTNDIITLTDGVIGTSSLEVGDVSEWVAQHVTDKEDLILTSISFNNAMAFSTGLPMRQFIHEGTGKYWETSLDNPSVYARWIVMANGDIGDPVYDALIKEGDSMFLEDYNIRAKFEHLNVYERKDVPRDFVYERAGDFWIDDEPFKFIGVNSYDLMYKTPKEIFEVMTTAKDSGIDVIRFWAFGEGFETSIQPEPGVYEEERLKILDQIMVTADQLDMKLIVTLSNYWSDYGGIARYLEWTNNEYQTPLDLNTFYTDPEIRDLYEKFVGTIVTRENSISEKKYKEDPVIMAWELMNEPRAANFETDYIVTNWLEDMMEYIHQFDKGHMILTGHEGFVPESLYTSTHTGPWLHEVAGLQLNSAVTAHYYIPDEIDLTATFDHPVIKDWVESSVRFDKPLLIEEVGYSKNPAETYGLDRETIYKNLFSIFEENQVDGVLLWNWSLTIDDSFGISPYDPGDQQLIQMIKDYSLSI